MSPDPFDERELSASPADATSALRDRLRVRLNVFDVAPAPTPTLAPPPCAPAPAPRQSLPPMLLQPPQPPPLLLQPPIPSLGGQIFIPAGVEQFQTATASVALLAHAQPHQHPQTQRDTSLFTTDLSVSAAPSLGGASIPYLGQPARSSGSQRVMQSRVVSAQPAEPVATKKRKRHPVRAFFSFLVVASLLGGAGFTSWYFLINKKVAWAQDVAPLATFVEETTHSKFIEDVPVTTLSVPEYEVKLGIDVLARSYSDADGHFGTLRAVGLVSGVPEPSMVGHIAAVAMTAFYSSADKTIYRMDGRTPAFDLATLRALTVALVDQNLNWSKDLATLTDAQQVGIRAAVDGVGAEVVRAMFAKDPQLEALVAYEVQSRTAAVGIAAEARPTYLTAVLGSYFFGAHTSPASKPDRLLAGIVMPSSDAPMFDPSRSSTNAAVDVPRPNSGVGPRTLGMQFWYLALLPRLGATDARAAALTWAGDSAVTTMIQGRACLAATISTLDAAANSTMTSALQRWAQSLPISSSAVISNDPSTLIKVSVCEPTEPSTQVTGPADATLLYSAPMREQDIGENLIRMGLPETQGPWSCAIAVLRTGGLANFVEGSTDPLQAEAMSNVLSYCKNA